MTQPNARYISPATTGEIFAQLRHGQMPGRGGAPQGSGGPTTGAARPVARRPGTAPGGPPKPPNKRFVDYPRYGRDGWRRWVPSWKLVSSIAGLGFATMVLGFFTAYAATEIPNPDELVKAQATTVYYADGERVLGRLAEQNRQSVELGQVPAHVQYAVLAAEDRSFWQNNGVNPTSIIRAGYYNLRGKQLQGGSTITQQYVKNYFDLRERTLSRKAKEFFIALKINQKMDKPEILRDYLNSIYFGKGAYGIQAASQAYFNKPVKELTVSEAAFLAGIINSPNNYDPADGAAAIERGQRRWTYVLDGMLSEGWITQQQRTEAKWPKFTAPAKTSLGGQAGYLMRMATTEAARELNMTEDELERRGLNIKTTFDPRMVREAEKSVKEILPKKGVPPGLQVAIATIDPRNGRVLAVYGGKDYLARQQNAATQDRAQAGSTFKPFGLIAALEAEIGLKSRFSGRSPMEFEGADKPVKNFGGESFGQIDLLKATASSVNTVYVQLNEEVGPEKTAEVAFRAGLPKDDATNIEGNLVNVLGSASPHPIDMAGAYATIANNGKRIPWGAVQEIREVATDKVVWTRKVRAEPAFKKEVVADAIFAMQGVVERGSGSAARALDRPVAGKTGTSSDSRSAWFVGFTPDRVTVVAMYQNDANGNPVEMQGFGGRESITGSGFPAAIWTDYMEAVLDDGPVLEFPEPEWVGEVQNPAPIITDDDDDEGRDDDDDDRPDPRPTGEPTDPGEGEPGEGNPQPTFPRPTLTLPTIGPSDDDGDNGNGNGRNGGG
jgi:membrane peptidoglycan carboxypeptidase